MDLRYVTFSGESKASSGFTVHLDSGVGKGPNRKSDPETPVQPCIHPTNQLAFARTKKAVLEGMGKDLPALVYVKSTQGQPSTISLPESQQDRMAILNLLPLHLANQSTTFLRRRIEVFHGSRRELKEHTRIPMSLTSR